MSTRLYEEFMKKKKVPKILKYKSDDSKKDFEIAIPLKGG